jgi:tetratricopeptide (TPR) repeat protein
MSLVRARPLGALMFGMAFAAFLASAQPLPELTLDTYPPVAREPIARALAEARARPQEAAAAARLGMLLHAWEQWEAAAAVYAHVRQLERRFEWLYLAGVVEERLAHHEEAAALFRDALALSPGALPARLKLADALLESGALEEAEQAFGALTAEPSAEPHARYGLGRIHMARGQHQEAVAAFDVAVRLYPEFGAAWYSRGLALRRLGQPDEARASLARAREFGTRWPGVPDPVLKEVRALRDDASAHLARGLALDREGDLAGAVREHEAAIAADPEFAQAHVNLVALYGRQQQWARADAAYREALRLGYGGAETHYNHGVSLVLQGREADAAVAFEKAVAANPQHAGAWNNLGGLSERAGRLDEALSRYRQAVDAAPADASSRYNLGRMLIANGRARDAVSQFEVLASADAPDPRHVYGLATALVLSGDVPGGRTYALRARALAASQGQTEMVSAIDRDLARLPQ